MQLINHCGILATQPQSDASASSICPDCAVIGHLKVRVSSCNVAQQLCLSAASPFASLRSYKLKRIRIVASASPCRVPWHIVLFLEIWNGFKGHPIKRAASTVAVESPQSISCVTGSRPYAQLMSIATCFFNPVIHSDAEDYTSCSRQTLAAFQRQFCSTRSSPLRL